MIISASRRTDIPAYYPDWFYNRIRDGYVCVRNPMNFHQVSRISLSPDVVDGIVFWTKNPRPLMSRLEELRAYPFYFQFTLTPYGKDVEPGVPNKNDVILPAFQELSRQIGPERVIWRYDPILFTDRYTMDYHITFFSQLARRLEGYTRKCMLPLDVAVHHQDHRLVVSHIPDQHRQFGDAQCLAGGLAAVSADDLIAAIPTGADQQR